MLRAIVQAPTRILPNLFNDLRELTLQDNIHSVAPKPIFNSSVPKCWLCLELLERLLSLAELHRYDTVKSLLDAPLKQSPEILTLALSQVNPNCRNALHYELSSHLMFVFFSNHANSSFVLHQVWASNRQMILQGMLNLYKADKGNLSRILEIAQDLKVLTDVLYEVSSYRFMVDLAALASRREFLFLEKWLPGHIQKFGEPFVRACVNFLKENTIQDGQHGKGHPPKTLNCFMSCLVQHAKVISPDLQEEIAQYRGSSLEQKVCGIFTQIYSRKNINEAVALFSQLKNSPNPDDREVFDFMVETLFVESQFFATYKDQLQFTGELFGSFIQYQIFEGQNLVKALIIILNVLRNDPRNILFQLFGLVALEKFKNSLSSMPEFCQQLKMIPHLLQSAPGLAQYLSAPSAEAILDNSIQQNPVNPPDQEIQDLVSFIFNNVSLKNLNEKANELKQKLHKDYFPWLAQYLIVKRVCIEENFHTVYLQFLDELNLPGFDRYCLDATLRSCKILLKSDAIITNSNNERNMLKSIGSWLGSITLSKNVPILYKQLDLKKLIIEAYQKGRLIAVVPFISKVLLSCKDSKIFRPPNSYVMLLIRLLLEVYNLKNLKLNINFEIELLCTSLKLKIEDIKPTDHLKNLEQLPPPNPDLNAAENAKQPSTIQSPSTSNNNNTTSTNTTLNNNTSHNNTNQSSPSLNTILPTSSNNLVQQSSSSSITGNNNNTNNTGITVVSPPTIRVTIDPSLTIFKENPQLVGAVRIAIEKAISEIIEPILQRFVGVACSTTIHLITKDFANEPNKNTVKKATHLMVKNLVGNLASVTCKDSLRSGIEQHLTSFLMNPPIINDKNSLQRIIEQICNDNLDMACHIIEYRAMEQAVVNIEKQMSAIVNARTPNPYARFLPPYLCADSSGLQQHQLKVYEDFIRVSPTSLSPASIPIPQSGSPVSPVMVSQPTPQSSSNTNNVYNPVVGNIGGGGVVPNNNPVGMQMHPQMRDTSQSRRAIQEIHDKFKLLLQQFELKALQVPTKELVYQCLSHIMTIIEKSPSSEETRLRIAESLFARLYLCNASLLDFYAFFLEQIALKANIIVSKITDAYMLLSQERKFDKNVTTRLIQFHLLSLPEFDSHIAKLLANGNQQALDFALFIMRTCISELQCINQSQLTRSIEAVERLQNSNKLNQQSSTNGGLGGGQQRQQISNNTTNINTSNINSSNNTIGSNQQQSITSTQNNKESIQRDLKDFLFQDPKIRENALKVFEEWCRLLTPSPDSTGSSNELELNRRNFLKSVPLNTLLAEQMPQFFALSTTVAVRKYLAGYGSASLDALAQLVSILFQESIQSGHSKAAIGLVNTALSAVSITLESNFAASPTEFNQQPYFHLFSFWLNDLIPLSEHNEILNWQLLINFANIFGSLQPNKIVGFCFSWVELISHRQFMPKLLLSQKGSIKFQELLVELFQFLEPFLRNSEITPTIQLLYNGTLRVLLVLVHDFPEFLCDYHFAFCDVIPPSCIQMRNLILSAFPRNMRLPDPATPDLKIDGMEDIRKSPTILSSYKTALQRNKYIQEVDSFLENRTPNTFLQDLRTRLLLPPQDAYANDTKYNVPLINSLVLYVGISAIKSNYTGTTNAALDIFRSLATELDEEGRYFMLNAIANQLRYPNNQTYYFSEILLRLFVEAQEEFVKEQITRVLLERLIVSRPHPWGLLITFIELLKNRAYNFWNHDFIHCAAEIKRLFRGVADQSNLTDDN